ncbi:hypothetical protein AAVH_04023 [Aphelenchoides avenae]|nr:hypothetical protein AAVH_04023 [Aphelenchus avenae]
MKRKYAVSKIVGVREDRCGNLQVCVKWSRYKKTQWTDIKNVREAAWTVRRFLHRVDRELPPDDFSEDESDAGNEHVAVNVVANTSQAHKSSSKKASKRDAQFKRKCLFSDEKKHK